ncbi:MAG: guanylate kinase [Cyclobacteriaceae bacterium]
MNNGKALIFSAPSGSGKTTIVKHLVSKFPELAFSISATTREPRSGIETDGKDYHFLKYEVFRSKIDNQELVEWEEVYEGTLYGTLKSEIDKIWEQGKVVVFDVDVKGGLNLKKFFGDKALAIFVKAPDIATLETRLKARKTEDDINLQRRLKKVNEEMQFEKDFDMVIVNKDLEESLHNAENITQQFIRSKVS